MLTDIVINSLPQAVLSLTSRLQQPYSVVFILTKMIVPQHSINSICSKFVSLVQNALMGSYFVLLLYVNFITAGRTLLSLGVLILEYLWIPNST